jgi:tetratricopeptide (TPR) repeat protein
MLSAFALIFLLVQVRQFQVVGETTGRANVQLRWAQIESIDRRFVDYTDIDFNGAFTFKKVPEGIYKISVGGSGVREQQRTMEVRPAFADARGRVTITLEIKDDALAKDKLKVGIASLAVSPKAMDELRRAYDAKGDVEKARRHLQRAIEISPNFDEALNNLGTYYYRDGKFDTAASLFQRALNANPNSFVAQVNLAGALISSGNYERALVENVKALEMRPDDSLAESQMGQALFHLQRYDEAMQHLARAKRIDPMSFTLPGLFIAQIHQVRGRRDEAVAEYEEFLRVHPGHPSSGVCERTTVGTGT